MITAIYSSDTTPGTEYATSYDESTGVYACNCRGWIHSKKEPRACKHTQRLAAQIADGTVAATPANDPLPVQAPVQRTGEGDVSTKTRAMCASALPGDCTRDRGAIDWTAVDTRFPASDWVLEEKLDGHRWLVRVANQGRSVTAWTRPRGSKDPGTKQLPAVIVAALRHLPDGVYDGEGRVPFVQQKDGSIVPGTSKDVQHWMAAARRDRMDNPLRLVLFDQLELTIDTEVEDLKPKSLTERREYLELSVLHYTKTLDEDEDPIVYAVEWFQSDFKAALDAIWSRGGEGAILKNRWSRYIPNARSREWVKLKREGNIQLPIAGFEAGEFGPYSKVLLRQPGPCKSVKTKNTEWRETIARNVAKNPNYYDGKLLAIEYTEMTPDGSLRHPRMDHVVGEA